MILTLTDTKFGQPVYGRSIKKILVHMKIAATVINRQHQHDVEVSTDGLSKAIVIPSRPSGFGSSVNGGEMLLLSLATCYCNDIYREAEKMDIRVSAVEVTCTGEFGAAGQPGFNFQYKVKVAADALPEQVAQLIRHTDAVAEIQNTLRQGITIQLVNDE